MAIVNLKKKIILIFRNETLECVLLPAVVFQGSSGRSETNR